jgi:short-subunit dehydrogenase involved in D-alanine esterification of teichoic acids
MWQMQSRQYMTNLLAPIRSTAYLLPLLKQQLRSSVMTVSSGLEFVPMAMTPIVRQKQQSTRVEVPSARHFRRQVNTITPNSRCRDMNFECGVV